MGGMGDAFAARLAKQRAKADNPDAVPDLTPPPRQPPPQALPGMAGGGGGGGAGPFGGGDAFAARLAKQRAKAENPEGVPTDLTPTKPAFAQAKEPSSGDLARDAFQARLAKQRAKADHPDMVPKRPSLTEKTDKKPAGSTMPPMDAKLAARLARQREKEEGVVSAPAPAPVAPPPPVPPTLATKRSSASVAPPPPVPPALPTKRSSSKVVDPPPAFTVPGFTIPSSFNIPGITIPDLQSVSSAAALVPSMVAALVAVVLVVL